MHGAARGLFEEMLRAYCATQIARLWQVPTAPRGGPRRSLQDCSPRARCQPPAALRPPLCTSSSRVRRRSRNAAPSSPFVLRSSRSRRASCSFNATSCSRSRSRAAGARICALSAMRVERRHPQVVVELRRIVVEEAGRARTPGAKSKPPTPVPEATGPVSTSITSSDRSFRGPLASSFRRRPSSMRYAAVKDTPVHSIAALRHTRNRLSSSTSQDAARGRLPRGAPQLRRARNRACLGCGP